mmetsp:Transcript_5200/g.9820  ORF Transcript_5200/g.9820 Transcript_5200/m.9820 type:complete len:358 (-) Transcript_5200:275-1348(-)
MLAVCLLRPHTVQTSRQATISQNCHETVSCALASPRAITTHHKSYIVKLFAEICETRAGPGVETPSCVLNGKTKSSGLTSIRVQYVVANPVGKLYHLHDCLEHRLSLNPSRCILTATFLRKLYELLTGTPVVAIRVVPKRKVLCNVFPQCGLGPHLFRGICQRNKRKTIDRLHTYHKILRPTMAHRTSHFRHAFSHGTHMLKAHPRHIRCTDHENSHRPPAQASKHALFSEPYRLKPAHDPLRESWKKRHIEEFIELENERQGSTVQQQIADSGRVCQPLPTRKKQDCSNQNPHGNCSKHEKQAPNTDADQFQLATILSNACFSVVAGDGQQGLQQQDAIEKFICNKESEDGKANQR